MKRQPLNRFGMENLKPTNVGTSAKKRRQSKDLYELNVDAAFRYRILNFSAGFLQSYELRHVKRISKKLNSPEQASMI